MAGAARGWLGFPSSLRARQVVLVAVAVLLVLLMALYLNHEAGRRQVEDAKAQTLRLAGFVAEEQSLLLESTRRLLRALAEVPAIDAPDPEACNGLLARLAKNDPIYQNFGVLDGGGRYLCGAAPPPGPLNAAARGWFHRLKGTGAFTVGVDAGWGTTGEPGPVAALPVGDGAGGPRRVLVASLSIAWLGELLQDVGLPSGTKVSVIDGRGTVLARLPEEEGSVGRPLPSAGLAALVLAADEGAVERPDGPDRAPQLYGFTAVDDTGVHVVVERPRASALAGVDDATGRLLLYLVGAELLILVGVFVVGRIFLLRPVEALAGAAARLASGDLKARSGLAPYRDDELGRLAGVFDDMARRLQDRQEALERRGARAEARFLDAIESVPHAFILWDADDRMVLCNRRYLEFFPALAAHARPGVSFEELARRSAEAGHFVDAVGREEAWYARRLERHRHLGVPFEWLLTDGRWVEVREYRTAEGGVLGIFTDVTERHLNEAALRESRERLRAALAAAETGTWRWDFATHTVHGDENLARLFGLPPEPARRNIREFGRAVHPDDREAVAATGRRCFREGADFDLEFRVVRPDGGGERWLAGKGRTFTDDGGVPRYNTGACVDITRHKRLERQQRLLLAELSHRVKNTLATVQSIAAQTLCHAPTPEDFAETFTGRLGALADVHGLLTRSGWESADLRAVVEQALRPHRRVEEEGRGGGNVGLAGPDLTLTPRACLALSLVLHELATNAAKYGALSVAGGRVDVRWWVGSPNTGGARRLHLAWRESGGPAVEPPRRRGFGSHLSERSLAYELDGEVELTYAETGVVCALAVPWTDEVGAERADDRPRPKAAAGPA